MRNVTPGEGAENRRLFGVEAIVALGCNLGDSRSMFDLACRKMERAGLRVTGRSGLYRTRPWGVTDQPVYLNAAVRVKTCRRPLELIHLLLGVERSMGRRRVADPARRWGPRPIDLDLLFYGRVHTEGEILTLPHPRLTERDFVLTPLIDLAVPPDIRIAPHGWAALLRQLPPEARTIIRSEPWQ